MASLASILDDIISGVKIVGGSALIGQGLFGDNTETSTTTRGPSAPAGTLETSILGGLPGQINGLQQGAGFTRGAQGLGVGTAGETQSQVQRGGGPVNRQALIAELQKKMGGGGGQPGGAQVPSFSLQDFGQVPVGGGTSTTTTGGGGGGGGAAGGVGAGLGLAAAGLGLADKTGILDPLKDKLRTGIKDTFGGATPPKPGPGLGVNHPLFDAASLKGLPESFLQSSVGPGVLTGITAPLGAIGVQTLAGSTPAIAGAGIFGGGGGAIGTFGAGPAFAGSSLAGGAGGGAAAIGAQGGQFISGASSALGNLLALGGGILGVGGVIAAPLLDFLNKPAPGRGERWQVAKAFGKVISPIFKSLGLDFKVRDVGGGGAAAAAKVPFPEHLKQFEGAGMGISGTISLSGGAARRASMFGQMIENNLAVANSGKGATVEQALTIYRAFLPKTFPEALNILLRNKLQFGNNPTKGDVPAQEAKFQTDRQREALVATARVFAMTEGSIGDSSGWPDLKLETAPNVGGGAKSARNYLASNRDISKINDEDDFEDVLQIASNLSVKAGLGTFSDKISERNLNPQQREFAQQAADIWAASEKSKFEELKARPQFRDKVMNELLTTGDISEETFKELGAINLANFRDEWEDRDHDRDRSPRGQRRIDKILEQEREERQEDD